MEKLKPQKVYEQVANYIQSQIEHGVYKPGDKLPTLQEMTEILHVGRATVREAFSALQAKGLIEIRHGEGSFIRKIDLELIQEPMNVVLLECDDLKQLLEVRKILEVGAAELAARNRTETDLKEMQETLNLMKESQDSEASEETDFRFHMAIAKAARNNMLNSLIQTIAPTMQSTMKHTRAISGPSPEILSEHTTIYNAIKTQNIGHAGKSMYEHIDKVIKRMDINISAPKGMES